MNSNFAAVDLGASSGRVMLAEVGPGAATLREVYRFPNRPVPVRETLHWDVLALWAGVLEGLRQAGADVPLAGIGVDSWAIDYALLDADGALLANPVHYRDRRTDEIAARLVDRLPQAELYARTGIRPLSFNTIYQLVAAADSAALRNAAQALLIPDLISYWLGAEPGTEATNASTTGLLDAHDRTWAGDLAARVGIRTDLFPALRDPGTPIGRLAGAVGAATDLGSVPIYTVASHDTASAVLGVPASDDRFCYISCGTWSLVGVELEAPITSPAAQAANFSNELGVDGSVRFLRNVMGLWLLQESVRTWERSGAPVDLPALLTAAAEVPGGRSVVDVDRPEFLPPGDQPSRMRAECRRTGQPEPQTPAEVTRCLLDSLAAAYRRAIATAVELTGHPVEVVHLVGGGARNALLCQLTADACELPVVAGPVEAAAYGNVLVQARAAGVLRGDRARLRALIPRADLTVYQPR